MNLEINIQSKKLELIQWLSTIEDVAIIDKIIRLQKKENKDWWNSISENEKQSIQQGIKDAEAGKLNPQSSARKIYEKWL